MGRRLAVVAIVCLAAGGGAEPRPQPRLPRRHERGPTHLLAKREGAASSLRSFVTAGDRRSTLTTVAALGALAPVLPRLPRDAAVTAAALVYALTQMAFDAPPDQVLLETVVVLVGAGVIGLADALDGFKSEGVVAVGVMCAVAKSAQTTGLVTILGRALLGRPTSRLGALVRMLLPVLALSAFMNNTPVCAMMMPIVTEWAASLGVPQSQLLMPLSFATLLGGTLTLIGSSTNLVAAGVASKRDPAFAMGMFDIAPVGIINALAGAVYMAATSRWLLPGGAVVKPAGASATSANAPPKADARMCLTLALLVTTMSIAARQPKRLVHVALCTLCVLLRAGCLTLPQAWSAVNGPVLLSIALSFALGAALDRSGLASIVAQVCSLPTV